MRSSPLSRWHTPRLADAIASSKRGEHELKGIDQPWELLAVEPHEH